MPSVAVGLTTLQHPILPLDRTCRAAEPFRGYICFSFVCICKTCQHPGRRSMPRHLEPYLRHAIGALRLMGCPCGPEPEGLSSAPAMGLSPSDCIAFFARCVCVGCLRCTPTAWHKQWGWCGFFCLPDDVYGGGRKGVSAPKAIGKDLIGRWKKNRRPRSRE